MRKETSSQSAVTAPPQHGISDSDMDLVYATDSVDDAIAYIRAKAIEPFSLQLSGECGIICLGSASVAYRQSVFKLASLGWSNVCAG